MHYGRITDKKAANGFSAPALIQNFAAFAVICVVLRATDVEDISGLAGLHQRSPLLAGAMTLSMVSLAGVPPLAGFFGKFLLLKAAIEQGAANSAFYWLVGIALVGVVISLYYYFGLIRAIYWSETTADSSPITVPLAAKLALAVCSAGILIIGLYPQPLLNTTSQATEALSTVNSTGRAVVERAVLNAPILQAQTVVR